MVQSKKKKTAAKKRATNLVQEPPLTASAKDAVISFESTTPQQVYENALDEVEDYAIIMLDVTGAILSWNKGAEKIKGYTSQEIIGRNYRIFYTKEDKDINLSEKLLEEARRAGKTNYEGWRLKKDGTRFWGSMTLTALHHENGSIRGFLKVTRDLTDRKIAEDNYSNFMEELRIKNDALQSSEERYHKMINEVMDYAIILLDKDGNVLDWNKGAEKLKGYSAHEIIGKSFRLFYPKEEKDSGLPERLLAETRKKGGITHEGWRIRKNGTRFWGSITITALHKEDGEIMGFSKVTRDLTDRKTAEDKINVALEELRQANEQLKRSEEQYHRMIEEIQDYAIILLNKDGDIQNWNAGAQNIKGYKANEIIGKNFRTFYTAEDRAAGLPERLLRQAEELGKANHEGWRVRKDGSYFWGSIVITALHNEAGEVIGFSKVTRDLTERKKTDDALKASAAHINLKNKTLERVNEELSSFTHVASHDLKEPLRKIEIFAAKVDESGLPEKSREALVKIRKSTKKMQALISDLLSFSQVANDASMLGKVDLNKVLQAVKSDLEIAISEKNADIRSQRLPVVSGIAFQLQQLFLNLLSNAIKFSKKGERPVIDITAEVIKGPDIPGDGSEGTNKYHHISVRDNGIGFEHQYNDRIFDAFQRLHGKDTYAGTGLGLAIVKKIVEKHNGIISAEGVPGEGATFHVYLPATKQNQG